MLLFCSPAELHASRRSQTISLWWSLLILIFWSPAHGVCSGFTEIPPRFEYVCVVCVSKAAYFLYFGERISEPQWNQRGWNESTFQSSSARQESRRPNIFFSLFSTKNEEMAAAKHENEDIFIDAQLQQTLADLDEDLEGRELYSLWSTKDIGTA